MKNLDFNCLCGRGKHSGDVADDAHRWTPSPWHKVIKMTTISRRAASGGEKSEHGRNEKAKMWNDINAQQSCNVKGNTRCHALTRLAWEEPNSLLILNFLDAQFLMIEHETQLDFSFLLLFLSFQ